MPEKFDRCVKSVMESGKDKDAAYAICTAQFKDSVRGHFRDRAVYDPRTKTAVSVRDGLLEYFGYEIGAEPADQRFRVYRSPATIANIALCMDGLPVTTDHVPMEMAPPQDGGFVASAEMIDISEPAVGATIAIRNRLALSDTLVMSVESGKRELSLGYSANLVPYEGEGYDFEQRDIAPHHLAAVDRGRCGSSCSFIDRQPTPTPEPEDDDMSFKFKDADGTVDLNQLQEVLAQLPEAIKSVPIEKLAEFTPMLMQIVEAAKGVMPEEETAPAEPMEDEEMPAEEDKKFSDAEARKLADARAQEAIEQRDEVVEKARGFLDDAYTFKGKSTEQIMRDALATEYKDHFTDSELPQAFKMLKKTESQYKDFGDNAPGSFQSIGDQEL